MTLFNHALNEHDEVLDALELSIIAVNLPEKYEKQSHSVQDLPGADATTETQPLFW